MSMENKLLNEQCDSLEQQLVRKAQSQKQDGPAEEAAVERQPVSAPTIEISEKDHVALLRERQMVLKLLRPESAGIDDALSADSFAALQEINQMRARLDDKETTIEHLQAKVKKLERLSLQLAFPETEQND